MSDNMLNRRPYGTIALPEKFKSDNNSFCEADKSLESHKKPIIIKPKSTSKKHGLK